MISEDGGSLSFPWIAWEALDAVWVENNRILRENPILDLIESKFPTNVRRSETRLFFWLHGWLQNVNNDRNIPDSHLDSALQYVEEIDTVCFYYSYIHYFSKLVNHFRSLHPNHLECVLLNSFLTLDPFILLNDSLK